MGFAFIVIVLVLMYALINDKKVFTSHNQDKSLKERLASGEITIEKYRKIKKELDEE